ncbi:MAG: hypothetical protein N2053_11720 [Chitinispirillaceae bacterium]|nr:hypothetical protein [Chitinispirillaceae bacterium]
MKINLRKKSELILLFGVLFLMSGIISFWGIYLFSFNKRDNDLDSFLFLPSTTPWKAIGGCGAGGSGSNVSDGIQWLGKGAKGGLLDIEVIPRYTLRKNFHQVSIPANFTFNFMPSMSAALNVPILSKSGDVTIATNIEPSYHVTGGIGDITFELSKAFGFTGEYKIKLGLTLPTGQYDIKRGSDRAMYFLPIELQMGNGVYCGTIQLSRTYDIEDGFWKFDISYSNPFNMRLFTGKNEMLDIYFKEYSDRKNSRRFYYRFKPYGENDLGAYFPPSFSGAIYFSSVTNDYVNSFGLFLQAFLSRGWVHSPDINTYAPFPDPNHKMWNSAFVYELELTKERLPLFIAVSLPLHDKPDTLGKIDGPDWKNFLNYWIFAIGIKTTLF